MTLLSVPRLTRHLPSTMSMLRTEVKVKARLVRPRRVRRRLKRRLNCPLSSFINDSFSTLYFGVLSNSSAMVRFRKSYLCFGGNISILLLSHYSNSKRYFSIGQWNYFMEEEIFQPNTCTHRYYSCAQRLLHYYWMEIYFSISHWRLHTLFNDYNILQGVASL